MELSAQNIYNNLSKVRNIRITKETSDIHTVVIPEATYSPWYQDDEFLKIYGAIVSGNFTLVNDLYRAYELWKIVGQTSLLGGDLLEVGVWRGGTGCLIAHRAQSLSPQSKVFLCDTFAGVVKASERDTVFTGGEFAQTSTDVVAGLAHLLGLTNVEILKGIFPDDTGSSIEDRRFSFCHVDVDVYDSARDVTEWVWPRLNVGGVIVYDDYGFADCDGVARFVNDYTPRTGGIVLHNLNGHAVIVKTANT